MLLLGFSDRASGKELPASAGDVRDESWIPGLGRSHGGGHGNPLQYFFFFSISLQNFAVCYQSST